MVTQQSKLHHGRLSVLPSKIVSNRVLVNTHRFCILLALHFLVSFVFLVKQIIVCFCAWPVFQSIITIPVFCPLSPRSDFTHVDGIVGYISHWIIYKELMNVDF